jgi:hypothetical protein
LLQAWLARGRTVAPYRLFALSNLGSMLALVSYPFLVEPTIPTRSQAVVWSWAYAVFVLLCCSVAWVSKSGERILPAEAGGTRPGVQRQLLWLALTACASTLLLAVTNHLTQNVASIPFLWVAPLALYLLSFILCFEGRNWYRRYVWLPLAAVGLGGMAFAMQGNRQILPVVVSLPVFCGGLFICCMAMHGELARTKPEPQHLTSFYLMCSLGGAVGGIFVGLLAPHIFTQYSELPLAMVWCAFLIYVVVGKEPPARFRKSAWNPLWLATLAGTVVLAFYLSPLASEWAPGTRLTVRNFYGTLRVNDSEGVRKLTNGIITHGEQILDPGRRQQPTSYYAPDSGAGLAMRETQTVRNRRVGVIGLGTGTLAVYGQPGDFFRFYEINPLVVEVARTQFTFLQDSKARIEVALGDARLSLEREPAENYDVLVIDAFTSDAIPMHLLTREAFALYFRHLKKSGVVAVHVSNLHLNLTPIVRLAADALGKQAVMIESPGDRAQHTSLATWVLVGNAQSLGSPLIRAAATNIKRSPGVHPWTDDYNNLFQVLR